ncbi:hypothetical protein DDE18_01195 [Nocardioides gansuensis]|uniref:Uncharacterized protein n=1 Tax=Nocardioides gansuensis TaxID=2138300 RepID=A0A2T8FEY0_9ACTN|nr:hypothetical protein DDE18_01195 [Nocardioides gansuensis]
MRLVPRWYTATVLTVLALATLVLVGLALTAEGVMGWSAWGLVVAFGLLFASAASALARRRRRREPQVTADGTRVFRAPPLTVMGLVGAWLVLLVVAALWAYVAVTDFDALESPGFSLVTIVGALASLPDFLRLVTGRLHRWTLELGHDSLVYRGYRTHITVPWSDVRGAIVQRRHPAGVRIDLRANAPDPVVPIAAFDVPAEQLVEEVLRGRKAASGR